MVHSSSVAVSFFVLTLQHCRIACIYSDLTVLGYLDVGEVLQTSSSQVGNLCCCGWCAGGGFLLWFVKGGRTPGVFAI